MLCILLSLCSVNPAPNLKSQISDLRSPTPDPRLAALIRRLPPDDARILLAVADSYELEGDSRRLLLAIRLIKNGGPGREMGVLHPRAQRFAGKHNMSLKLQAQWAAGTIHKHFTGDLDAFARHWCPPEAHPLNANWLPAVRQLMGVDR